MGRKKDSSDEYEPLNEEEQQRNQEAESESEQQEQSGIGILAKKYFLTIWN